MSTCHLCGEKAPRAESLVEDVEQIMDHLRVVHPEQYGEGPERWPDGGVVLHDADPTVADFGGAS